MNGLSGATCIRFPLLPFAFATFCALTAVSSHAQPLQVICSVDQQFCGRICCDEGEQCITTSTGKDLCVWCPSGTHACGRGACCEPSDSCIEDRCGCANPCGGTCCPGDLCLGGITCCSTGRACGMRCMSPHQVCALGAPFYPWDVVPLGLDSNGFWVNPNWAWEIATNSSDIERSPKNRCGEPWSLPCTSLAPRLDNSVACPCTCHLAGAPSSLCPRTCGTGRLEVPCGVAGENRCLAPGGHVNWGIAKVTGQISYLDLSGDDNDFAFLMDMRAVDGARVAATRIMEFRKDDTVDNFYAVPWWREFGEAVDQERKELVGMRKGVAIGLFSLDGGHSDLKAELHPVWALGLNVPTAGSQDDKWVVFYRKKLPQGYCSANSKVLTYQRVNLELPWRAGASGVIHNSAADRTIATENTTYAVTIHDQTNVTVTISVDDDAAGEGLPWFAGEINLRWDVVASQAVIDSPPEPRLRAFDAETAEMSVKQRQKLEENFSKLAKLRSEAPQRTAPARLVSGVELVPSPISDPTRGFTEIPADEAEERWRIEAIRNALGKDSPTSLQEPPK